MADLDVAANKIKSRKNIFYRFFSKKESTIFLALLGIMLIITIIAPKFDACSKEFVAR